MSKLIAIEKYIELIKGMNIIHTYYPSPKRTKVSSRTVEYIVMHYTGNKSDTAEANAKYYTRLDARDASAHFFVDNDSICQSVPLKDIAWHCGSKTGYRHNYCRNSNSVGIEMCTSDDYIISSKTIENAAYLCASLCLFFNITDVDKYVLRHYDVTGKSCPAQFVSDSMQWNNFKKKVKSILNGEDSHDYIITPLYNIE